MKIHLLIFLSFFIYDPACTAQPWNKNTDSAGVAANWKKGRDTVFKGFPKEYTKGTKKILDSMAIWTASSFSKLSGFNKAGSTVEWHALLLSAPEKLPLVPRYQMKATIPIGAGSALLTITANDLAVLGDPLIINGHTHWLISPPQLKDSGIYAIGWERVDPDSSGKKIVMAWLVCLADSLPYAVVDRKEYFEAAIDELGALKDSVKQRIQQENPGRNAEEEDAYRKNELRTIDNSFTGNERLERERTFFITYKPDSVFQEDSLKVRAAAIIEKIELIKSLLASLRELHKPAFVSAPAIAFEGLEDGLPGTRLLIRLRPDYFRKEIPRERPQFIVLSWEYDTANLAAAKLGETIGKELDWIHLRDMVQLGRFSHP